MKPSLTAHGWLLYGELPPPEVDSETVVEVAVLAHGIGLHRAVAHGLDEGVHEHQEAEGEAAEAEVKIAPTAKWSPARPVGRALFILRVVGDTRPGPACTTKVTVLARIKRRFVISSLKLRESSGRPPRGLRESE